jgi:hypothetical protein
MVHFFLMMLFVRGERGEREQREKLFETTCRVINYIYNCVALP